MLVQHRPEARGRARKPGIRASGIEKVTKKLGPTTALI
jgi:hypothetical protein